MVDLLNDTVIAVVVKEVMVDLSFVFAEVNVGSVCIEELGIMCDFLESVWMQNGDTMIAT